MADDPQTTAPAELTLEEKLAAAEKKIAELAEQLAGPKLPPALADLSPNELMVKFLDGVHVLLGSHPSIHDVWQELRSRFLQETAPPSKV